MISLIKDEINRSAHSAALYAKTLLKWIALALVVGLVCGAVGVAFHFAVDFATEFRGGHPWVLYILPAAGLAIVGLYKLLKLPTNAGTNQVIEAIRTDDPVPISMAFLIFVSTVLTHLFGGSAGREGAALQIGGSIGNKIGRVVKLSEKDKHLITLCGMSAVFSALFGTPLTAAVFVLEVVSVGEIYYAGFVPCIVSALVAFALAQLCGVPPTGFTVAALPELAVLPIVKVALLGVLCAVLSMVFCIVMHKSGKLASKLVKNEYLRIVLGGAVIIVLTLLVGGQYYNGAGMNFVAEAVAGNTRPLAFVMKIIFTAITLGCGFKGGEIVPTFYVGATFGCLVGPLLGLDAGFAAAVGIVALFCGVVNCPIASIILSIELFGSEGMLFFAIACGVSYILSGYYGLYSSQKIIYSKLGAEYINVHTH